MPARIAWKPLNYDPNIASGRLRAYLPCRYLQKEGWPCEIFQESHLKQYEVIIFQKCYEESDILLAQTLRQSGVKTAFDLCDNHFYNPEKIPAWTERAERLQRMLQAVDVVIASTTTLATHIPAQNKPIVVIDDAIDEFKANIFQDLYYRFKLQKSLHRLTKSNALRIVWFGNVGVESLQSGITEIPKILPTLEKLNKRHPITLSVISNSQRVFNQYVGTQTTFPVEYLRWKKTTFPYLFQAHNVCIIPATVNPFTICKSNNRLVLSLMLGLPVVAEVIPSYEEFRPFILSDDWEQSLWQYIQEPELRQQHVEAGQAYIRANYNRTRVIRQWAGLLESLQGNSALPLVQQDSKPEFEMLKP